MHVYFGTWCLLLHELCDIQRLKLYVVIFNSSVMLKLKEKCRFRCHCRGHRRCWDETICCDSLRTERKQVLTILHQLFPHHHHRHHHRHHYLIKCLFTGSVIQAVENKLKLQFLASCLKLKWMQFTKFLSTNTVVAAEAETLLHEYVNRSWDTIARICEYHLFNKNFY